MPAPRKPLHLRTGHSKGAKEVPRLGIVPARTEQAVVPKPPTGLSAKSRRVWRNYWQSQVSGAADQLADMPRIERWITQLDEYEKVWQVFVKTRLVKGSKGQVSLNPLAGHLATLETQITRAEKELGMTPLARAQLGVTFGEAKLTAVELNRQLSALEAGESTDGDWSLDDWDAG